VPINCKLTPAYELDPAEDDMSRTWTGWSPHHSDAENFEQNRGVWVLGPRAAKERVATFSLDGTVRLVARIERLETIPAKAAGARSKRAVVGHLLGKGDPAYDALFGTTVDGHRNPVTYIDGPDAGPSTCACGCGGEVAGHRAFLPGHDQRAIHERIARQWGNTLGFIDWFDAEYPRNP